MLGSDNHVVPDLEQDSKTGPFGLLYFFLPILGPYKHKFHYIYIIKTAHNKKEYVKCPATYPSGHHYLVTQGHIIKLHNYSKKSSNENRKNLIETSVYLLSRFITGSSKGTKWVIYNPSCCFSRGLNLNTLRKRYFPFNLNNFKGRVLPPFFNSGNWPSLQSQPA